MTRGTCSDKTKRLLSTADCNNAVFTQQLELMGTFGTLAYFANCTPSLSEFVNFNINMKKQQILKRMKRVTPITIVNQSTKNTTELNYRNTLHRYPWICSLRSITYSSKHLCAVTLLSLKPRVIVGPAHCTYVCKDRGQYGERLASCCCTTGRPSSCSRDVLRCGLDPTVVDMLASDADILCGEWQTGGTTGQVGAELYNVELRITNIAKHPGFDASQGPIGGNDIAVFKTADKVVGDGRRLKSACLPPQNRERPTFGIHAGWATAPEFQWLEKNATHC